MPIYKITMPSHEDPFIVEADSEDDAIKKVLLLPEVTEVNGDIEEVL
jgi:hypothetical protein